jgi:hypothetical protein
LFGFKKNNVNKIANMIFIYIKFRNVANWYADEVIATQRCWYNEQRQVSKYSFRKFASIFATSFSTCGEGQG